MWASMFWHIEGAVLLGMKGVSSKVALFFRYTIAKNDQANILPNTINFKRYFKIVSQLYVKQVFILRDPVKSGHFFKTALLLIN